MRTQTKAVLGLLALMLVIQPYLLQTAYASGTLTEYLEYPIPTTISTSWWTSLDYYNTSGNFIGAGQVESYPANSTMTMTLATTAQDTTKRVALRTFLAETTIWNASCFDTDNDEYVTAIGITIETPSAVLLGMNIGFSGGSTDLKSCIYSGTIRSVEDRTEDNTESVLWISPDKLSYIHQNVEMLDGYDFLIEFYESDADEFINGAVVEIEVRFYSGTTLTTFYQYLLWFGALNFLIALGMTRAWNPMTSHYVPKRRYRTSFRKYYRRPRFRRPRYRGYRRRYR